MPEIRVIAPRATQNSARLRVAAYCRVSSDSADQLNSFAAQVNYYTTYIQSHPDWSLVDIYADEGVSGTSAGKREEFLRLMRDCRQGKIDRILTKSISRFARNVQDCVEAVRELRQLKVSVCFEKERLDTALMANEMLLSMMSAFAQEESVSISQNMRKGAVMRMKNGTFRLSQLPYGYRYNNQGILVSNEQEAEIVRRIYHSFLSGKGIQKIAAELERQGVPKMHGEAVWSKYGVRYILTNERYAGDERFRKSYRSQNLPFRKIDNHGEETQFWAEDTHEGIVDKETFQKVQDLLKQKKEQYGKKQMKGPYPLTRMLCCGECGARLYRRLTSQGVSWICSRHLHDAAQCSVKGVLEAELYQAFIAMMGKLKSNRDILEDFQRQLEILKNREIIGHPGAIEANSRLAKLLEQNRVLHQLWEKGCIDQGFFLAQSNSLNQQISGLRWELKQYRDQNEYKEMIDNTKTLSEALIHPDCSQFPVQAFQTYIRQAVITTESVTFQLINGLDFTEKFERRPQ